MRTYLSSLRGWRLCLAWYAFLLLLSHLTIWLFESPVPHDQEATRQIALKTIDENGQRTNENAIINYKDISGDKGASRPVIFLLPGGPEGPEVFDQMVPELRDEFRLIIPHLPGNLSKGESLPDYSFGALADYSRQLAAALDISRIHLVGFGLGGASAIHWAHNDTARIQSVTLISSIGVQELELLGGHTLNHAVYGIQLGAVWLLHNAIPHFGLFGALNINVPYAKSYYESDQRPIRSYLRSYEKPMLIVHGSEDPLVPDAIAREHHRIVPQSILQLYDADHSLTETHSESVADDLRLFVNKAEKGKAPTIADATDKRLAEADKPFSNVDFAKFEGISLLIILLIIVLSTLISEDLACIGAGLLAARGLIDFWPATLACMAGIFIGDVGLYLAGRFVGRKALSKAPLKWLFSESDLDKSSEWFRRRGPAIIVASRFLPGSRLPTYFSAGVIKAGFWMFIFYFLISIIIWTPLLVGTSKILGSELLRYFSLYQGYIIWVFLALVVLLIVIAKAVIPAFSYKGRRLLVSRYRRITRWQYWPSFALYLPVALYVLYLGLKHRSFTLFTLANPEIPDGGFTVQSRSKILSKFDKSVLIRFLTIPAGLPGEERIRRAYTFMDENDLTFPMVLKPDVGVRGKGVQIVNHRHQLEQYILENNRSILLQEYIDGKEYGIFYYRYPSKDRGDIFSIVIKNLVYVVGDGQKTTEELILANDQTVTLAKHYLRQNKEQLYEVPEEGERLPVVRLGMHSRGAIFEEGSSLKTKELTEAIDRICRRTPGFYFGRLDIKVPSQEALDRENELTVIEVNGVNAVSLNIYDKHITFFRGIRILCRQWRLAFAIGAENRKKGMKSPKMFPFLRRVFQSLGNQ